MPPLLQLYEDNFASDAILGAAFAATPRMIFVVHGQADIGGQRIHVGETWFGTNSVTIEPCADGVSCWRWELTDINAQGELARGKSITSHLKLSAALDTLPAGELLWRGDSVWFPPGACAYRHTQRGPGIRCLLEGGIRIDSENHSTSYGPGGAWYEAGPEAVFAQAAADRPSRFIRVMILPRTLLGQSSISYVNEDDKTKPKSQQYQVFVDAPIG